VQFHCAGLYIFMMPFSHGINMSKFDPQKHRRRSIRLKGYDYSQAGAYYVTIVVQGRICLFGEIVNEEMHINEYGEIVQKLWNEIPTHFPNVELGAFVIMPNHVHGIIYIIAERRARSSRPVTTQIAIIKTSMLMKPRNGAGGPCPYTNRHWDKLLRISNTNPPKR
jgi:REP element-mobilizing transposase RayT